AAALPFPHPLGWAGGEWEWLVAFLGLGRALHLPCTTEACPCVHFFPSGSPNVT
ncbi:unnamed protein product, partial [Coccothraustes coccothraustes]